MAREHARIWLDINDDEDFQSLSFDAQGFYARIILTEPTLNYCGVFDWRPNRLTVRAPDLTLDRIQACAAELEARRYVLFDLATEEGLARSYVRRDELIRNPKMAATVIKAFPAVASKTLRGAIISELIRIHDEHPDYSSWTHKDTAAGLSKLLAKTPLEPDGYTPQITYPIAVQNTYPNPVTNGIPHPVTNTDPNLGAEHQSQSVPIPSTSTLHPSPAPLGGYVSGERYEGAEPESNAPPKPNCPEHPNGTSKPCGGCRAAREARDDWDIAQAVARAKAITACGDCGEDGYRLGPDGLAADTQVRCTHPSLAVPHA